MGRAIPGRIDPMNRGGPAWARWPCWASSVAGTIATRRHGRGGSVRAVTATDPKFQPTQGGPDDRTHWNRAAIPPRRLAQRFT